MPALTVIISEALSDQLRAYAKQRKAERVAHKPSEAEVEKAKRLATSQGLHAANFYLKSLSPPKVLKNKIYLDLIERGQAEVKAGRAKLSCRGSRAAIGANFLELGLKSLKPSKK